MQKKYYLSLAIVPVLILLLSFSLRKSQGPFFYNNHYDPAYPYLVSSLNISEFKDVNFYTHPGTTVQFIGAIAIKLFYFTQADYANIVEDVLAKPETYLYAFISSLILITTLSIFLIGLMIYKATNNIYLSVFVQLSAICSYTITYELSMIKPENLIVPVTLFLVAAAIKFTYDSQPVKWKYYEILFALICGIGLATKITFLPLVFVPFIIIPGIKRKLLFLGLTGFFFVILIFPVFSSFSYFIAWIKNLLVHSGKYGTGNTDVVDSNLFVNNIKEIFRSEIYFFYAYLLTFIFLLISLFGYFRKKIMAISKPEYKLLISLFFSMSLMTILIAKQYAPRYMIPALLLSSVSIYLVIDIVLKIVNLTKKIFIRNAILVLLSGYIGISSFKKVSGANMWNEMKRKESAQIEEYIKTNHNNTKILTCYGSSSLEYALSLMLPFSGSQNSYYKSILKKKYPNNLFFEPWVKKIHSINGTDDVKEILNSNGKLILKFQTIEGVTSTSLDEIKNELTQTYDFKDPQFVSLYGNSNNETIYEVILK